MLPLDSDIFVEMSCMFHIIYTFAANV